MASLGLSELKKAFSENKKSKENKKSWIWNEENNKKKHENNQHL